jgi:hypothetical protein
MRDGLLVRHFLYRFLDHDLVSPDVDRHVILSTAWAGLTTATLFVTVLVGLKYQAPVQSPGRVALSALDDQFLYVGASWLVMALVVVIEWQAIALDMRDTLILGPLPISHGRIVRAKFVAVGLFAAACMVALNAVPTVVYPWAVLAQLPAGFVAVFRLILIHGVVVLLAAACGFLGALAMREGARAVLGEGGFARLSGTIQATLLVGLVIALLLLPAASIKVPSKWFTGGARTADVVPPLWFVGLYNTLAGRVIEGLPRARVPGYLLVADANATEQYRSYAPLFRRLAMMSLAGVGFAAVIALAAAMWNSRRLPSIAPHRHREYPNVRRACRWLVTHLVVRTSLAQAAFFLTMQSLVRSYRHRTAVMIALAIGVALCLVTLHGVPVHSDVSIAAVPTALLTIQPILIAAALMGFQHAARLPADLRASWIVLLTWSGDARSFLTGVKRAGIVLLAIPVVMIVFVGEAWIFGVNGALWHAVHGLLLAGLLTELLFLPSGTLPLTSAYQPAGPAGVLFVITGLAAGIAGVALGERLALTSLTGSVALVAVFAVPTAVLHGVSASRRRRHAAIELDEPHSSSAQRLELIG